MDFLICLWLPILVTAIVLFFASFVAWAILPFHFKDWKRLPNESEFMGQLRDSNIEPGNYSFPFAASPKDQGSQEFQKTYATGPRGILNVYAMPNMGANMGKTVLYFLITAAIIAYVSWEAFEGWGDKSEVTFPKVFQIVGAVGALTYACGGILNSIWFKKRQVMDVVDGIVYGVITGLIFATFHVLGWAVGGGVAA